MVVSLAILVGGLLLGLPIIIARLILFSILLSVLLLLGLSITIVC